MEKHEVYDIKFKLKAMDVAKKKSVAAAASREFGMKHSSSNNIILDQCTNMQIIFVFLSSTLTQLLLKKIETISIYNWYM